MHGKSNMIPQATTEQQGRSQEQRAQYQDNMKGGHLRIVYTRSRVSR